MVYIVFLEPGFLEESSWSPGSWRLCVPYRVLGRCSRRPCYRSPNSRTPCPRSRDSRRLCPRTCRGRACSGISLGGVLGGCAPGARVPGRRATGAQVPGRRAAGVRVPRRRATGAEFPETVPPNLILRRLQRLCCPAVFLGGVFGGSLRIATTLTLLDESAEFLARLKERTGMKAFEIWAR